jgi:endonuclease-8
LPEGDTIHRSARRLREALAGRRVTRFDFRRDPKGIRTPPPGTAITDVEARGKHLLIRFDDGATLHTHMQMTGRWDVYSSGQRWRRPAFRARVVIEVDDGTVAVCFDAPTVELRRDAHPRTPTQAGRALANLGPDLAQVHVDIDAVLDRMDALAPETSISATLLDQRVASGVGNVFKSEVCWACRVSPFRSLGTLDRRARHELMTTAHQMLVANIDRARRTTYGKSLAVYRRAGRPCPRCRSAIQSQKSGDPPRLTYWCPSCQT